MIYTDGQKIVSTVSLEELDEFARSVRIDIEYYHQGAYHWYEIPGSVAFMRVLRAGVGFVNPMFLPLKAFHDDLAIQENPHAP